MASKPSRDTLIHCESCGEDYSATYRRCPFCGERSDPRRAPRVTPPVRSSSRKRDEEELDDGYVFDGQDAFEEQEEEEVYSAPRPKGGKRLAPKQSRRGGVVELPPINWPRLITFLCSLIIIVAALVIVFTVIYPQLHAGQVEPSAGVSEGVSQPPVSPSPIPTQNQPPVSEPPLPTDPPVVSEPPASQAPSNPTVGRAATVVNAAGGLRVRAEPNTNCQVLDSLVNGNHITVISDAGNGWYRISYAGEGGVAQYGYIMGQYISN